MSLKHPDPAIRKCLKGDLSAFAGLCEMYYDYAYRVSFRMLAQEEDARDTVQEAFIRVWKNLKHYDEKLKFSTWLYSIVTHLCIDHLRKKKFFSDIPIEDTEPPVDTANPESALESKDLRDVISNLAGDLGPKQRAVFVLRDLEGLEMKEVGEITHLSPDQVKSNLYHARRAIREILIKEYHVAY
jgi:RNA polymerase sigma-70 factor (ECF subfamily)